MLGFQITKKVDQQPDSMDSLFHCLSQEFPPMTVGRIVDFVAYSTHDGCLVTITSSWFSLGAISEAAVIFSQSELTIRVMLSMRSILPVLLWFIILVGLSPFIAGMSDPTTNLVVLAFALTISYIAVSLAVVVSRIQRAARISGMLTSFLKVGITCARRKPVVPRKNPIGPNSEAGNIDADARDRGERR